jgi:tol-pal system protein YbgF
MLVTICLAPLPAMAQSPQEAAQLAVRIQQLEEQIRLLTGQVEGLQFQLTQMQTLIEKQTADNEFRFQQLEGGAPPPANSGAIGDDRLPADPTTTAALPEAPVELGTGEPMDDLPLPEEMADSADPLVGTNSMGTGVLGGEPGDIALGGSRPLNLSLDGGAELSNGDAAAQYQAGYDAIVRGDYAFAEDQFQQFVALYPDDPNAPDATNWLGEALMQRGAFDDAALVLAEGYQKYQNSERAPDLMLKLGIALLGAGEPEVACRTFFTLEKRYPNLAPAFVQRLNQEKSRAQCPV